MATRALLAVAFAPLAVAGRARCSRRCCSHASAVSRSRGLHALLRERCSAALLRVRDGLRVFRTSPPGGVGGGCCSSARGRCNGSPAGCLLLALGLAAQAGVGAAAAVLFAVNVTAVIPATPANVGVFQAACVAVLAGAYHVSYARSDRLRHRAAGGRGRHRADHGRCPRSSTRASPGGTCACARCTPRRSSSARCPASTRRAGSPARARHRRSERAGISRDGGANRSPDGVEAWVYVLRCRDGSLYTGWTTDLARRLRDARHGARRSRYTASACPSSSRSRCRCPTRRGEARGGEDQGAGPSSEARDDRAAGARAQRAIAGHRRLVLAFDGALGRLASSSSGPRREAKATGRGWSP